MQVGGKDVKVLTCESCAKCPPKSSQSEAHDSSMLCTFVFLISVKEVCTIFCDHPALQGPANEMKKKK